MNPKSRDSRGNKPLHPFFIRGNLAWRCLLRAALHRPAVYAVALVLAAVSCWARPAAVDSTFNAGAGLDKVVNAVAIQPDGRLVVGGDFLTANGLSFPSVVRLLPEGLPDVSFNPGVSASDQVRCVALDLEGHVVQMGRFLDGLPAEGYGRQPAPTIWPYGTE
jgi:hypothetical protein